MRIGKRAAIVTAGAAVVLAAAGGVAIATAGDGESDDLTRPGTVAVDESALPDDDAAETEALAELATVDEAAATAAAVESVGGEAVRAELEDEDGFVVWEVEVRAADGTLQEVTVDAGDGGVLGTEAEDDDGTDDDGNDDGTDDDDADDEDDDD